METESLLIPNTDHGLLVAFGEFAWRHGLIDSLMHVPIRQKECQFAPQTKLVEFLVGILGGIEYLEDLNGGPRPLVKDRAVCQAWHQPGFAHYSTVSRTLEACDEQTVVAVQQVLDTFSQPFIAQAVSEHLRRGELFVWDLDLTGQAVSSTSQTYPEADFGWMDDAVRLGYQLARVCWHTPLWGRIWLAGFHHPGSTASVACLQELVLAAERQTRVRPRRRTEQVQQRLRTLDGAIQRYERLRQQQMDKQSAQQRQWDGLSRQWAQGESRLQEPLSQAAYQRLSRQRDAWQRRMRRIEHSLSRIPPVLQRHGDRLQVLQVERASLQAWLEQLQADNAANPDAPLCQVRMDAGFASGSNLTWLIEMGYISLTKALSDKTTQSLRGQVSPQANWVQVGDNAEMLPCGECYVHDCPYPLIAALERFKTGCEYKHATLLTFQEDGTTPPVPEWFRQYNRRQTIEAGNKELKGPFHIQHLMSRSLPGIRLQVLFAGLSANLIRWCTPWLRACSVETTSPLEKTLSSPKRMVRVAANAPALVQHTHFGLCLRFTPESPLPNVTFFLKGLPAFQPSLGFFQPYGFSSP